MKTTILSKIAALALATTVLPLFCLFQSCRVSAGQHGGTVAPIHAMHEPRAGHTATVLRDGRVLIAGGFRKGADGRSQIYSATAELYDPKTRTFARTGDMHERRCGHTATLLPDGRVLVAGGVNGGGTLAGAEVFDPARGTFAPVGRMTAPRGDFTATLLQSGDVLLCGGGSGVAGTTAELFHPSSNQFSATGSMHEARSCHTATLLPDGSVLVAGGADNHAIRATAERYDPAKGAFVYAGTMGFRRQKHAAVLLADGHVLIMGGSDERDGRGKYKTAEIYDWRSEKFTPTIDLMGERFKFPCAVAQFENGCVLICGGNRSIEEFDFLTKRFGSTASLDQAYYYGTASALADGTVLILGGYSDTLQATDRAWLYKE